MHFSVLYFIIVLFIGGISFPSMTAQNEMEDCSEVFKYVFGEFEIANQIKICNDSKGIPLQYVSRVNIPVCDDTLCANVILKIYWDLAGNYEGFDTIPGFPLTKFDHIKFTAADYQKLDEILKNRNSMLRILNKTDLIDKSVKVKSKTVDAVTGATPATIKKSVVEGAVYSSYTLWHFVNGPIKNRMSNYTLEIYSEEISSRMLLSNNYETQLFALRKWDDEDFENHSETLFQLIKQSAPVVKANAIIKAPLPFEDQEKNNQLIALFPDLDNYSQSIFINRILTEKNIAEIFIPLIMNEPENFNEKQWGQILEACVKYKIQDCND